MRTDEVIVAAVLQYYAEHRRVDRTDLHRFVIAKFRQRFAFAPEPQHIDASVNHLLTSGFIELREDGTVLKVRRTKPPAKTPNKQTSWGWEK